MTRDGNYAIFNGKEYRLISRSSKVEGLREYELLSFDNQDIKNGFVQEPNGKYRKKVTLEQLERAFSIYTWCKYKGYDFQIILHLENDIYEIECITAINPIPVEQLGFTFAERGVYRKRVKKDELDSIYEVKTPILGFE